MDDKEFITDSLLETEERAAISRREWFAAAGGGLVLAAGGLHLPDLQEDAAAREGARRGQLGGRHGQNHRGRDQAKRRDRGDRKDKNRNDRDKGKSPGTGSFDNAGLTVRNAGRDSRPSNWDFFLESFNVTFYAQRYTGGDKYDAPFLIQDTVTVDLDHAPESTVTPDLHRCGALIQHPFLVDGDLYVDVWDVALWFPQGRVLQGKNLDPPRNKLGSEVLTQRSYIGGAFFRTQVNVRDDDGINDTLVFKLARLDDGKNRVRFEFFVY